MFVNYVIDNLPDQMFKTYIHMVIFRLERAQDMTLVRLSSTPCCVEVSNRQRRGIMQWLKLPAWKVRDRGFEHHSGFQVSKKQYVPFPFTHKDSILWGASVTEK